MTITYPHTFTQIVNLPVQLIQEAVVLSDDVYVYSSFASDEDLAQFMLQDKNIVVRAKNFPPDRGCQAGGGRNTMKIDGIFAISIWLRLWLDEIPRDDAWLTNATLGMAPMVDAVVDAMEQAMPLDSNNRYYFIQPARCITPGWQFLPKRIGAWQKLESLFSVVFWMAF